jgi:tRNA pseudouridine-54 N-methylase
MNYIEKADLDAMPPAERAAKIALNKAINAAHRRRERQWEVLQRTITRRRRKIDEEYAAAVAAAKAAYRAAEDADNERQLEAAATRAEGRQP